MDNQIKVLFVQQSNDSYETESLWCTRKGGNYLIDNIPFIAKRIALRDTIKVEFDTDENVYYFDDFVEVSGNSTIRVYVNSESSIEDIRKVLSDLGCESEVFLGRRIIAINVPYNIDYTPVKRILDEGEKVGEWTYEESCLAHEY